MGRFKDCGAVLEVDTGNLEELRKIYSISGNPTIVNSPFGKSISFDNSGDFIALGLDTNIMADTSTWSYVVRVKVPDTGNCTFLYTDDNWQYPFYLYVTGGKITAQARRWDTVGAYHIVTDTDDVPTDSWVTIGVSCSESGGMKLYVNGVEKDSTAMSSGTYFAGNEVSLGKSGSDFGVNDFIVFDRVLIAQEMFDFAGGKSFDYEKNCVGSWDMSSVNPSDLSGNGNDGNSNGTTIVNSFEGGKATNFDGSSGYITLNNSSVFELVARQDMSYSCWFRVHGLKANTMGIYDKRELVGADLKGVIVGIRSTGVVWVKTYNGATTATVEGTVNYNDGVWHNLVATLDRSGNQSVYIDKVLIDVDNMSSLQNIDLSNSIAPILGFKSYTGSSVTYFDGDIDKFKVFDKALSSLEVKDLYNKQLRGLQ